MGRTRGSRAVKATVVAESPAAPAPPGALANATHLENVIQEGKKLAPRVQSFVHFYGENFPAKAVMKPEPHPSGERRAAEHVPTYCDGDREDDIVDVLNGELQQISAPKHSGLGPLSTGIGVYIWLSATKCLVTALWLDQAAARELSTYAATLVQAAGCCNPNAQLPLAFTYSMLPTPGMLIVQLMIAARNE